MLFCLDMKRAKVHDTHVSYDRSKIVIASAEPSRYIRPPIFSLFREALDANNCDCRSMIETLSSFLTLIMAGMSHEADSDSDSLLPYPSLPTSLYDCRNRRARS